MASVFTEVRLAPCPLGTDNSLYRHLKETVGAEDSVPGKLAG